MFWTWYGGWFYVICYHVSLLLLLLWFNWQKQIKLNKYINIPLFSGIFTMGKLCSCFMVWLKNFLSNICRDFCEGRSLNMIWRLILYYLTLLLLNFNWPKQIKLNKYINIALCSGISTTGKPCSCCITWLK